MNRARSAILLAWVGGAFSTGTWWLQVIGVLMLLGALGSLSYLRADA